MQITINDRIAAQTAHVTCLQKHQSQRAKLKSNRDNNNAQTSKYLHTHTRTHARTHTHKHTHTHVHAMSAKADRKIVIGDSSQCSQHAICITPLHSNRQTLTEENSRTWLVSDRSNLTPDLLDKIQRLHTPHTGRFNSNRLEIDTGNYVAEFLYFFQFCC
jgi:hypothetical protein